jgi:hypothetical protein
VTLRGLLLYLAAGVALAPVVALADGSRGLTGCAAAWLVCLVPLAMPWRSRVAARPTNPRIGGGWGLLHSRDILFRLGWTLAAGAGLYHRYGDDLGVGFWIALLVFYQVMLALRTFCRLADHGDRATHASG